MMKSVAGSLVAIPSANGCGIAKVIFQSEYFADTICIKLFKKRFSSENSLNPDDFSGDFDLYYTSLDGFKKKRWMIVAEEPVSNEERALTKRTSGGEVWVEDSHLGAASDSDLAALPKMLVHGFKLIEKYVGRYTLSVAG